MRSLLALVVLAVALLAAYWGAGFYQKLRIGRTLASKAVPFQNLSHHYGKTLLVLGDSTGVGVGASRPEDSIAGLLARDMNATYVENGAVSGAQVADLGAQIQKVRRPYYDTILVQIAGNDIIRFHDSREVSAELGVALDLLRVKSDRVLLMSAGDVGTTTIFPPILDPFYTRLTLEYHAAFTRVAAERGATYINLYTPPERDPFLENPSKYFAADGLHLTSAGYALWYDRLKETVAP